MLQVAERPHSDPCDALAPPAQPTCRALRAAYAQVLSEPIPDSLHCLLGRLRAAETASDSGT